MATLTRWNPIREVAAMQSSLDRLFDDSWRTMWPTAAGNALPVDLYETDSAYLAVFAIPGVSQDQINIRFENGVLTVSAEIPQQQVENARVLIQERGYGRYSRSITLPEFVEVDKADAHYENGMLTLNLPKRPEAQPKQITIKVNGQKQLKSN
jgi:HSP20 family protein